MPGLHDPDDVDLVVLAAPLATRAPAHQRLVDLDGVLATDRVALGPHHASTQLVEDLVGGLVPTQRELPLEL